MVYQNNNYNSLILNDDNYENYVDNILNEILRYFILNGYIIII